mmetsp:Transcript_16578/g.28216  ORF Transcript_16578/g.28216 Transcript_16578/m.28216 type:complete len:192 (+) Transcript_16578:37-612(+)
MEGAGPNFEDSIPYPDLLRSRVSYGKFKTNKFEQGGWKFVHGSYPIMDSNEVTISQALLDEKVNQLLGKSGDDKLNFIQQVPEMFYGKNRLFIYNEELNVCLSFSPFDALSQCVGDVLNLDLQSKERSVVRGVDVIPEKIALVGSEEWSQKDTSDIEGFQKIDSKMDWTFSTPYKGFVHRLTEKVSAAIKE